MEALLVLLSDQYIGTLVSVVWYEIIENAEISMTY